MAAICTAAIFCRIPLTTSAAVFKIAPLFGGIAQLGERLHGMQEVSGSIPLTSTKKLVKKKSKNFA